MITLYTIIPTDTQVLKAAYPLHFKLQVVDEFPLLPHVHCHLLCLVCIEGEVVVLTPSQ